MVSRSLAELKRECLDKGLLVSISGKKEGKADYVNALRNHFLQNVQQSFGLKYRLSMQSPQLAFLSNHLRKEEINEIMTSSNWVFERKLNGVRMIVCYYPETGFEFFSRNVSVEDYIPVSYTKNIWIGDGEYRKIFPSFVLDTEVMSSDTRISTVMGNRGVITETELQAVAALLALNEVDSIRIQRELHGPLKFHAFDCLYYDGKDLRSNIYIERRKALKEVMELLEAHCLPFERVKAVRDRKKEYLESIWDRGGEGVIAKRLDMTYLDTESRPRNGWIKFKRTVSGSIGDSIDAVITGYDLGEEGKGYEKLVGSLRVSVLVKRPNGVINWHEIARVPNIPLELRKQITTLENGRPVLRKEYLGRVVEVEGQSVSARALRLTHPRLIRWRDDKSADQTTVYNEQQLRSLIL